MNHCQEKCSLGRRLAGRDAIDHEHDEQDQRQDLEAEQDDLQALADLQPAVSPPSIKAMKTTPVAVTTRVSLGQLILAEASSQK